MVLRPIFCASIRGPVARNGRVHTVTAMMRSGVARTSGSGLMYPGAGGEQAGGGGVAEAGGRARRGSQRSPAAEEERHHSRSPRSSGTRVFACRVALNMRMKGRNPTVSCALQARAIGVRGCLAPGLCAGVAVLHGGRGHMSIVSKHVLATVLTCAALGAVSSVALAADAPPATAAPAPTYQVPKSAPQYIRAAVENPSRPAEQKARDAVCKPAEVAGAVEA